jgi:hypothetical protein
VAFICIGLTVGPHKLELENIHRGCIVSGLGILPVQQHDTQ